MSADTPRPEWAREKQPEPPNFGQAKMVSEWRLNWQVRRRRTRCEKILARGRNFCQYDEGKVSLIVLSCKRLYALQRLCDSMLPFFRDIEDYPLLETVLVDNGSGSELVEYARGLNFFDLVIAHETNRGMAQALNDAYKRCRGEYVVLVEDDMLVDYDRPFLRKALDVFATHPEIGIVRLKNQNNWWKPFRVIGPLRTSHSGVEFWTWLPSRSGENNVWACGSVMFRKVSFFQTGLLEAGSGRIQAELVENSYASRYNKVWLAAKVKECYPMFQPNDNPESPGFEDEIELS